MAESSENNKTAKDKLTKQQDSSDQLSDEFADRQDELIDDEDAIERLLMDNAFDSPDQDEEDEFAEIDELISERFENTEERNADEFVDDQTDETVPPPPGAPRQEKNENGLDEFIEIDEFAEDEDASPADQDSIEEYDDSTDDDERHADESYLMADFDISADEPEFDSDRQEERAFFPDQNSEPAEQPVAESSGAIADLTAAMKALETRLAHLQDEQHRLGEQLLSFEGKEPDAALAGELDGIGSEQKKFQRRLTALEQRKPMLAYTALAMAIVALLVGAGLGFVALSADSRVADLTETVVSLEDQVDAWMAKSKGADGIAAIKTRLDRMDMEVANFSARLSAIDQQLEKASGQNDGDGLRDRIDQLNDRSMQTASVVEALQQKMDRLEKNQNGVARKSNQKAAVSKQDWKVNLVSFKQEWYAKRKAAEFVKQGVPAEVTKVEIKGETWYRLRVKGFDSKYEAAAYAAKVKKRLNLASVWVTKD